jgi:small subunit ribosomal protein S6
MTDTPTSTYEGIFLFPQAVISDMQAAVDHVNSILDRAGAEVIALSKWDERRLAYDIKGNKRGVYFLAYFKVAHDKLSGIERDCNLSEQLLRALVTRADHIPAELIESTEGRAQLSEEIKLREVPEDTDTPRSVIERAEAPAAPKTEAPAEVAEVAAEAPEAAPEAEATAEASEKE